MTARPLGRRTTAWVPIHWIAVPDRRPAASSRLGRPAASQEQLRSWKCWGAAQPRPGRGLEVLMSAVRSELLAANDETIEDAVQFADPMVLRGLLYQLTGDEALTRNIATA